MFRKVISTIAILTAFSPAFADSSTPSAALQAYVKTVAAATSWSQITPLMSDAANGELSALSAADQKGMLGFITGIRADQKDFRIVSEEINGIKATIHATGCLDGESFDETTQLEHEAGTWKVRKVNMGQDGKKC